MHRHTEDHPTRNEDEYFARESAQLIKEMRSLLDEQRREVDRREHFMKCPKCGGDLKERDFEDVKVDVCPDCHGIWLDQGEIGLMRHIHESRGPFSRLMSDILEIFHQRIFTDLPAKGLVTDIECEARDRAQLDKLLAALRARGYAVSQVELN